VLIVHLPCPVCLSLDPADYREVAPETLRCRADGVWINQSIPTLQNIASSPPPPTVADDRLVRFMEIVGRHVEPGATVHDLGCGQGDLMQIGCSMGFTMTGNDIGAGAAEAAARHGFSVHTGQIGTSPWRDVDAITSACVFPHHMADWRTELDGIKTVLRSNGLLFAEMPDAGVRRWIAQAALALSGRRWGWMARQIVVSGSHQYAFDRRSITAFMSKNGLKVVALYPFPSWSRTSRQRYDDARFPIGLIAAAVVPLMDAIGRLVGHPGRLVVVVRKV